MDTPRSEPGTEHPAPTLTFAVPSKVVSFVKKPRKVVRQPQPAPGMGLVGPLRPIEYVLRDTGRYEAKIPVHRPTKRFIGHLIDVLRGDRLSGKNPDVMAVVLALTVGQHRAGLPFPARADVVEVIQSLTEIGTINGLDRAVKTGAFREWWQEVTIQVPGFVARADTMVKLIYRVPMQAGLELYETAAARQDRRNLTHK